MSDLELSDHDRLIKLEQRVDTNLEGINDKLSEQKTLMTNHLAHHEATEKARIQTEEKKSDRWFKLFSIVFQGIITVLLTYLIMHLK